MSPQFLPVPQGSPALEPPLFQVDTYFKLKKLIQLSCYPLMCCEREKWATRLTFEPDLEWPTQRERCICSHCFHIFLKDFHICLAVFTFVWKTPVWLCCQCNGVKLDQIQCKQKLLSQGLCVTVRLANNKTNGKFLTAWLQVDSFLMKKWQIIFVTDVKLLVEHIQKASTDVKLVSLILIASIQSWERTRTRLLFFDIPGCSKNRRREAADLDQDVLMHSTNVAPAEDMDAYAHLEGWDVLYNIIFLLYSKHLAT